MQHKILVSGATGTVGGQLVKQLVATGHQVVALTRNPDKARFPAGVEVVQGNLTDPATFAPALERITGLHLITFDGDSYGPLQSGAEIVALARAAGVQRVTVLLGPGESNIQTALRASDLSWTFIQPVEFMSNMLEWAEPIRGAGVISQPFGDRRTAIVHEADIAAVAATALVAPGHAGQTCTVTGPEVLTPREMLAMIGDAIGRELRWEELTEAEARAQWQAAGYPEETIEFLVEVYGHTPEIGCTVTSTVEQVTGRPARTFAEWAREHADAFRSE